MCRSKLAAWIWWTVTMPLALAVLGLTTMLPGGSPPGVELVLFAGIIILGAGVLTSAQWLVLRRTIRFRLWLGATVIGWLLGFLAQLALFQAGQFLFQIYVPHMLHGAVFGLILGGSQWVILKRSLRHSALWLPLNGVAWGLAWLGMDLVRWHPEAFHPWIMLPAGAALVGALTGGVMVWMLAAEGK